MPCFTTDKIDAPVNAVGTIDIHAAGRTKHGGIADAGAAKTVRCRVFPVVGLRLDNQAADTMDQQANAYQLACHLDR